MSSTRLRVIVSCGTNLITVSVAYSHLVIRANSIQLGHGRLLKELMLQPTSLEWLRGTDEQVWLAALLVGVWQDRNESYCCIYRGSGRTRFTVFEMHRNGKHRETRDQIDISADTLIMGNESNHVIGLYEELFGVCYLEMEIHIW